uniref:NADH dehydrogenase subunit 3 n=1 Tax=Teleogryllus oceanicus TaxID=128161 RepID=A0A0S2MAF7_9ORTH|nr:NADH dehydrogenase subunit 3 [Teleogryllus oceanicus]ALO71668.1 NADH dehydrogenase subunit 3 [Teleogryllus oceanicus]
MMITSTINYFQPLFYTIIMNTLIINFTKKKDFKMEKNSSHLSWGIWIQKSGGSVTDFLLWEYLSKSSEIFSCNGGENLRYNSRGQYWWGSLFPTHYYGGVPPVILEWNQGALQWAE